MKMNNVEKLVAYLMCNYPEYACEIYNESNEASLFRWVFNNAYSKLYSVTTYYKQPQDFWEELVEETLVEE